MAKILVVYDTAYGHTQRIARRIADRLTAQGHGVCLYRVRRPAVASVS